MTGVQLLPVTGVPEVREGDDLAGLLVEAITAQGVRLADGDVLAVSSKVVSKAAGLWRPTEGLDDRDAVVRAEARRVVAERRTPGGTTRITQTLAGPVMAASGVDASNLGRSDGAGVLVLPREPDAAASALRDALLTRLRAAGTVVGRLGVVVTDTAGRPWREGQADIAIGAAGLLVTDDLRGATDADGRPLAVTVRAVADEIASAADLVKGKAGGVPAALVRGLGDLVTDGATEPGAEHLVRSGPGDWFALGAVEAVRSALGVAPGTTEADAVGIPSAAPEPASTRADRAVRVARHAVTALGHDPEALVWQADVGEGDTTTSGPVDVRVSGEPWLAGLATGLLTVALRGEGLEVARAVRQ